MLAKKLIVSFGQLSNELYNNSEKYSLPFPLIFSFDLFCSNFMQISQNKCNTICLKFLDVTVSLDWRLDIQMN